MIPPVVRSALDLEPRALCPGRLEGASGRRRGAAFGSSRSSSGARTRRSPRLQPFSSSKKKVQELWGDEDDDTNKESDK
ncbi:MAG: hypothetical protein HC927_04365 [Deltaproteobacteria bacterium]|nr:hypothetical protein [Deltaproteobacteria bacterium]